jgi:eukaryotic-like serine/threonine-protein kinase
VNLKSAHFLPGANKPLGRKYRLLECLGDGTHGWVWRAERLSDHAIVAVKIPKQLSREDRALAEGKELIGVAPHPNVIRILDMGRVPPEKEWYAIEMEYFPSESLAQKLEHRTHHFGNTYQRLFRIYAQVLDAVAHLASLPTPISHGDIKPHNILVGQDDLIKLTDFGSSALPEEIYVRTRENGGTVLYSAPEFSDCVSRKGSFPALLAGDIYSLGVLLYQLTTGRLPHDTQAQVRSHAVFPKPREINSSLAPELETVILRCLQREPSERFSSIETLIAAFKAASKAQLSDVAVTHPPLARTSASDWSTEVVQALERLEYLQAAAIAAIEYAQSQDTNALLMQLNALFRAERWFDFQDVYNAHPGIADIDGEDGSTMRLLGIKVFLRLKRFDRAEEILRQADERGESSLDHALCAASMSGLQADYHRARSLLEDLNRRHPRHPEVLRRLVQVCEQQRDYHAAAGFLRVALKVIPNDERLLTKRERYETLGAW